MTFTITFGEPKDVTNPGQDGVQCSFPFSVVDAALIGTPEEAHRTTSHRIIVPISRSRLAGWPLSQRDLVKILFEYGKRHVVELIENGNLPDDYTIWFPIITTVSHPDGTCPFDPQRIKEPDGLRIIVEQAKPQIGFGAS